MLLSCGNLFWVQAWVVVSSCLGKVRGTNSVAFQDAMRIQMQTRTGRKNDRAVKYFECLEHNQSKHRYIMYNHTYSIIYQIPYNIPIHLLLSFIRQCIIRKRCSFPKPAKVTNASCCVGSCFSSWQFCSLSSDNVGRRQLQRFGNSHLGRISGWNTEPANGQWFFMWCWFMVFPWNALIFADLTINDYL